MEKRPVASQGEKCRMPFPNLEQPPLGRGVCGQQDEHRLDQRKGSGVGKGRRPPWRACEHSMVWGPGVRGEWEGHQAGQVPLLWSSSPPVGDCTSQSLQVWSGAERCCEVPGRKALCQLRLALALPLCSCCCCPVIMALFPGAHCVAEIVSGSRAAFAEPSQPPI